jgi:hypothetical protein
MNKILLFFIVAAAMLSGCRSSQPDESSSSADTALPDTLFNDRFLGDCGGFTGGDGTYSVLLPDGRTAWIFGDTFIEGVNPDNTREPQDPIFVRNAVVVQDGDQMTTLYQRVHGKRASFAIHPDSRKEGHLLEDSVWFWPGDGYVERDQLRIFYSEMVQADTGMWGFDWRGTWIGSYSLPDLEEIELVKLRDRSETHLRFGHAVCEEGDLLYVYGAGDEKNPYAARYMRGGFAGPWEYFDGEKWQDDIDRAAPMGEIHGSEQFSVFPLDERYVLVTQMNGISDEICSFTSVSPFGPWENKQLLYTTPLPDSTDNLFTYNAVAHPQFTEDGMLLISYNTNSYVLQDHFNNALVYRPRFIRVPVELILEESEK